MSETELSEQLDLIEQRLGQIKRKYQERDFEAFLMGIFMGAAAIVYRFKGSAMDIALVILAEFIGWIVYKVWPHG